MDDPFYTPATWHVSEGHAEGFVTAWHALGAAFLAMPGVPPDIHGTLVRRLDDPLRFVSIGPWPDEASSNRMRADPRVRAALARVRALCQSIDPATYVTIAHAGTRPGPARHA